MDATGIRKWSFTRQYDVGDGPWPAEDEATIAYESETPQVVVSGVFIDGGTTWEGCVRRVAFVPEASALHLDVGVVETGRRVARDIAQRIHYEVRVEFFDRLPERTLVRHVSENDETQFSTTAIREESERP